MTYFSVSQATNHATLTSREFTVNSQEAEPGCVENYAKM